MYLKIKVFCKVPKENSDFWEVFLSMASAHPHMIETMDKKQCLEVYYDHT